MTYLLDTNVVSEPRRARPAAEVMTWLREVPAGQAIVSVISLGKIRRGIEQLRGVPNRRAKLEDLERWQRELSLGDGLRLAPVDAAVADRWGRLKVELRSSPLPTADALIAATALSYDWTLATRNVRHFERTGVRLVNPFGDES